MQVPPFIAQDEKIRVNNAEGRYQERAQAVVKPAAPGSLIIEMRVFCLTAFLCASAAFAQGFGPLATNKDGSKLYFSTPLRMKESSQYLHLKIFTWDQTEGIGLYEQRPSDVPFPFPYFGFIGTQFFSLIAADVSSDGKTVAITGVRFCNFSDICGQLVIYQAGGGTLGPARLSAYSVASGSSTDLVTIMADAPDFRASISDEGSLVAFVYGTNRQLYVVGSNGSGMKQISNFSEPVTEVELSGDGTVAFVVTAANRIARINVASAQSMDLVSPTPYLNGPAAAQVSRGTTLSFPGSGFATAFASAQPPYPLALSGVELQVGGIAVPIAGVTPTSVTYPATWDVPDVPVDVEVWAASANASPFVPGFQVSPARPTFSFGPPPGTGPIAIHQDFSLLVTDAKPAQPGRIHPFLRRRPGSGDSSSACRFALPSPAAFAARGTDILYGRSGYQSLSRSSERRVRGIGSRLAERLST